MFFDLQGGAVLFPITEAVGYEFLHVMFQSAAGGLSATDVKGIRVALNFKSKEAGGEPPFTRANDAKHGAELRTLKLTYGVGHKHEDVDRIDATTVIPHQPETSQSQIECTI